MWAAAKLLVLPAFILSGETSFGFWGLVHHSYSRVDKWNTCLGSVPYHHCSSSAHWEPGPRPSARLQATSSALPLPVLLTHVFPQSSLSQPWFFFFLWAFNAALTQFSCPGGTCQQWKVGNNSPAWINISSQVLQPTHVPMSLPTLEE